MRRESVASVAERVMRYHGGIRRSDANGIIVARITKGGGYEEWRIRCGSGIAGHGGLWWLQPVSALTLEPSRGPFSTVRQFETELRRWKRWETEFARGEKAGDE